MYSQLTVLREVTLFLLHWRLSSVRRTVPIYEMSQRMALSPIRIVRPAKSQITAHPRSLITVFAHRMCLEQSITKTYLYNFDPFKPHFYMVKLGFTGYTLVFLFLLKNIDCGDSLEPPRRGGSNEYPQSMF